MAYSKKRDIIIVVIAVILAAASLTQVGNLHIDSSTDAFMPNKSPVVKINKEIESIFGSTDAIMVGISLDSGTIFEPKTLTLIDELTSYVSTLPSVHQVMSLTNTDHMQSGEDGFEAVPLYTGTSDSEIASLIEKIESWKEAYEGNLVSADYKMAALIIQPEVSATQAETDTLVDTIKEKTSTLANNGESFSLIGLPLVKQQINRSLLGDVAILAPIVGFLILLVLFFSFRRVSGVILPLVGLILSASITLGIMAIFKITVTMATILVPVLLLIVGSAYAIHVMSHFYEGVIGANATLSTLQTHQIISTVIKRNRMPIVMAGATTAAGFIAQFTSPLGPFRTFGLLSAVGVVLSQLSSLYLLPALLRLTYPNGVSSNQFMPKEKKLKLRRSKSIFDYFEKWARERKVVLIVITALLVVVTIVMVPFVKVGTDMLKFFHPSTKLVQDTNTYNEHMAGSGIITIMIDGKESSAILEPQFLATLDTFVDQIEGVEGVGKVQTILPYLKRMNLIMNQDNQPYRTPVAEQADFDFFGDSFGFFDEIETPLETTSVESVSWDPETYNEIPLIAEKYALETQDDLKALLSQYLLLFSGNLDILINDDLEPSATLITLQMHDTGNGFLRSLRKDIDDFWTTNLPDGWSYAVGGGEEIALALTDLVTQSQIYSLVGALLIVWLLVSFIFRSPVAGLIGLIPVTFALMGIFISMVAFNIGLDVITSLLAALAIGIGVDYAIHFMAACQREGVDFGENGGLATIMKTTGQAIVINAASVTIGFAGLLFSRFIPIRQMAILFCVSMVFAALSSLIVLPMALLWVKPKFLGKSKKQHTSEKIEIRSTL